MELVKTYFQPCQFANVAEQRIRTVIAMDYIKIQQMERHLVNLQKGLVMEYSRYL